MKRRTPWLFYGVIIIVMVILLIKAVGVFLFRNWSYGPLKLAFKNTTNSEIYSNIEIKEIVKVDANIDVALLSEAGFLFPPIQEDQTNSYTLDYLNSKFTKNSQNIDIQEYNFRKNILGSADNIESWKQIIANYKPSAEESKDEIIYKFSEEGAKELITLELTTFAKERFGDYIEPTEV
ncbi:hypothetical protein KC678_04195, partial [Candidatus Dojkabacteria bacterium]|nr:hypothetical protein [Candidatus Dojkabacteria bacterium]